MRVCHRGLSTAYVVPFQSIYVCETVSVAVVKSKKLAERGLMYHSERRSAATPTSSALRRSSNRRFAVYRRQGKGPGMYWWKQRMATIACDGYVFLSAAHGSLVCSFHHSVGDFFRVKALGI